MRATFIPASISAPIISGVSLAGPSVATILVRRIVRIVFDSIVLPVE
jgi:hypothetical protein